MQQILQPFMLLNDLRGVPLQNGALYFGLPGQAPGDFPVTVYWDAGGDIVAVQPIRTINGVPARDGTPSTLYINVSAYSFAAYDKNNILVFYTDAIVFSGPTVTTTTDGWMTAADKVVLNSLPPQVSVAAAKADSAYDFAVAAVVRSGDTMSGPLFLVGDPPIGPTDFLQAATKNYADVMGVQAWATISGTGTVVATGRNVASCVRSGVGLYTVTLINALQSPNFVVGFSSPEATGPILFYVTIRSNNYVQIQVTDHTATQIDVAAFDISITGGLG